MDRTAFIWNNIDGTVLDIGCSEGHLHRQISNKGVYGIDIKIKKAFKNFVRGDAQFMPFKSKIFDSIIAGELIEHLNDPEGFLLECKRIIRKGGVLIITTPNKKSWVNRLLKSSFHPEHVSLFDANSLQLLVSRYFRIERFFLLSYDEISCWGSRHKNLFWVRKLVHNFLPVSLQEEMVLKAINS